jgi:hypothetical protein
MDKRLQRVVRAVVAAQQIVRQQKRAVAEHQDKEIMAVQEVLIIFIQKVMKFIHKVLAVVVEKEVRAAMLHLRLEEDTQVHRQQAVMAVVVQPHL